MDMTRKYIAAATAVFLCLTAAVAYLGWRGKVEVERVAVEQFNSQQLILAEKISQDISEHFSFLRTCLTSLAVYWPLHPDTDAETVDALREFFALLKNWDVLAMGYADHRDGQTFLYDNNGLRTNAGEYLEEGKGVDKVPGPHGRVFLSRAFTPRRGPLAGRRIMTMSIPVSSNGASGEIFLIIDPRTIADRYAEGVTSGETGYAWIVDEEGVTLEHYEEGFINRTVPSARIERNPDINWGRLSHLLHERMLKGERGMDYYVSGWHRGMKGPVKKLMAFCPVHIGGRGEFGRYWSVAVTAPVSEVDGVIGGVLVRQVVLVVLFEIVVMLFFAVTLYFSLRWSESLKTEVDRKAEELLRAQETALRSERFAAIGQAAAHLSHEIKNPLMLMGGFAGQVRKTLPEGKDAEKLKIIEDEAQRLEHMLVQVKNFTRPNTPQKEPGDMNEMVESTLKLMESGLSSRNVTVRKELASGLPRVPFDRAQMKQVLINLIKNAGEAMEGGGTAVIRTEAAEGGLLVSVADNGPGVDKDMAARLFEPFITTKDAGTGLGLPVCNRIVEDHGGRLTLESEPGKGAVFSIYLPKISLDKESSSR